ncbi:hypothetical protein HDE_09237 [Halotydeus destructor]|nr:hypothetical protein HDE_09237 [Halotydeus destructor]
MADEDTNSKIEGLANTLNQVHLNPPPIVPPISQSFLSTATVPVTTQQQMIPPVSNVNNARGSIFGQNSFTFDPNFSQHLQETNRVIQLEDRVRNLANRMESEHGYIVETRNHLQQLTGFVETMQASLARIETAMSGRNAPPVDSSTPVTNRRVDVPPFQDRRSSVHFQERDSSTASDPQQTAAGSNDMTTMRTVFEASQWRQFKLSKFEGKGLYKSWLNKCENMFECSKIPVDQWVPRVFNAVRGSADNRLQSFATTVKREGRTLADVHWFEFRSRTEKLFDAGMSGPMAIIALREIRQGSTETASAYLDRAFEILDCCDKDDDTKIGFIIEGLKPDLRESLLNSTLNGTALTMTNVWSHVTTAEKTLKYVRSSRSNTRESEPKPSPPSTNDQAQRGRSKSRDNSGRDRSRSNSKNGQCYNCKEFGHFSRECPKRKDTKAEVKTHEFCVQVGPDLTGKESDCN